MVRSLCGTCKGTLVEGAVDYGDYQAQALSDAEKARGQALFCRAVPQSDLTIQVREIAAAKDIRIRILPCRVVRLDQLATDVMALYLKLPQHDRLQFLAGQYIDILLRDAKRRSFSLANAPHDDEFLQLHIKHVPNGLFSGHVFSALKEKDLLRFEGPFGNFFLREDSTRPAILMAGGTGFAPIKGILEHAFHIGVSRPLHLFWGVRAKPDLYLHALAQRWEKEHANFRYTPVLSEPKAEDRWTGATGWVHEAVVSEYPVLSAHEVYMSGPPPMVNAAKQAFGARGLAEDCLFYDSFESAVDR
jgi:CDP-4-dehydro-6-deoxyglucose reductase, E3